MDGNEVEKHINIKSELPSFLKYRSEHAKPHR